MDDRIEIIQIDLIEPHPANRRIGGFDQTKLEQLAESIKAVGVQQPAIVRKIEPRDGSGVQYQLVAGERRWRASRIAGNDSLPCIVRELDDIMALKIQTIENLQRDDVHPLDEADGYSQLIAKAGYTIETIAAEVGKSSSYIYQRMKLSSLIEEAKQLFVENKITAGHAILIARLGPDQQREIVTGEVLFDYDDDVMSVRDLDDHIHNSIMLDMSQITWKIADAELVPEAGSCDDCPKRTGYQPQLFADVCNDGKKKKDYCTDRACFTKKQNRIVEVKRAELKDQEIIEVADGYSRDLPKDVIDTYRWNECKKKDPGAKKVLVVAGNQPGRVTYGTINTYNNSSYQKTPEQKESEKKERQKLKAAEDLRAAKADSVLKAAAALPGGTFPLEALRICILSIWRYLGHDRCVAISKAEGWIQKATEYDYTATGTSKHIDTMNQKQLNGLLLRMAITDEVKIQPYCTPSTKTIDALIKIYGVEINDTKKSKKK
jgi:ParB/RepB/Spo0J family partition protein